MTAKMKAWKRVEAAIWAHLATTARAWYARPMRAASAIWHLSCVDLV
jgi:hypothetical protein